MERTELPIAVFDSGLGGISVLRALVQRLPGEDFLYFGDSANAPYGVRPVAEVRRLTQDVIGRLYDRGIKAAVIACNTATSAAIGPLRAAFPDIPVIGIEPALKPAVAHHRRVLVLATPLTLREEIRKGNFREDLYHRIGVVVVRVPALREHAQDIPLLVDHFIRTICAEYHIPAKRIEDEALAELQTMPWSGNIRELRNVIERLIILSEERITPADVKAYC